MRGTGVEKQRRKKGEEAGGQSRLRPTTTRYYFVFFVASGPSDVEQATTRGREAHMARAERQSTQPDEQLPAPQLPVLTATICSSPTADMTVTRTWPCPLSNSSRILSPNSPSGSRRSSRVSAFSAISATKPSFVMSISCAGGRR